MVRSRLPFHVCHPEQSEGSRLDCPLLQLKAILNGALALCQPAFSECGGSPPLFRPYLLPILVSTRNPNLSS